jgi:hypothetical protein
MLTLSLDIHVYCITSVHVLQESVYVVLHQTVTSFLKLRFQQIFAIVKHL